MSPDVYRSTPARLTSVAAQRLPRPILLLIGLVYIIAGLYFRDPWKADDVIGLATMMTALQSDNNAWLLPQIGSLAYAQNGPMVTWAGAICIVVFSPLLSLFTSQLDAAIIASRIPNLLWMLMMSCSVWYGVYLLGRRPEAQPLALPFGGEPPPHDYGRILADAALLLLLATVGILLRMHETSSVPAMLAFQALAFYAATRMLDRPLSGALTLGLALACLFFTRGWLGLLPALLASLWLFFPGNPLASRRRYLPHALIPAAVLMLAWWIPARLADTYWTDQWLFWHTSSISWPSLGVIASLLRDLPWFLWPTWPFALLALWRWRDWMSAPHIRIPLAFLLLPLLLMLFLADVFEPEYSMLVIPSALLAAFALPTLRRGIINSLDWFSVMCFSLAIATVWLGWIALHSGWPHQISENIALQTRGYEAVISWPALFIAAIGTLFWVGLVRWRLHTHPAALWRGTILSSGGLIATWLLLASLWMPAIDYARSYRDVSFQMKEALQQHVRPGECVRPLMLGLGQRASLYVFQGIEFSFSSDCSLILQQVSPRALEDGTAPYSDQSEHVLWEGKRAPDRHEMFRLLRLRP